MSAKYAANPSYVEHERQLLRLHELIAAGESESDAADAIRDAMDETWWKLSREEQDRLAGLSGDLYALSGDEVFEVINDSSTAAGIAKQLEDAVASHDWAQALELLRRRPSASPTQLVDAVRSLAYLELGHPRPALAFIEHGLKADPSNFHLRYQLMCVLTQLGYEYEAVQRGRNFEVIQEDDLYWIVHYTNLLPRVRDRLTAGSYQRFCLQVIEKIRAAIGMAETQPDSYQRIVAYGYASLALCQKELGRLTDAVRSLGKALSFQVLDTETAEFLTALREETIKAVESADVSLRFATTPRATQRRTAPERPLFGLSPQTHASADISSIYTVAA